MAVPLYVRLRQAGYHWVNGAVHVRSPESLGRHRCLQRPRPRPAPAELVGGAGGGGWSAVCVPPLVVYGLRRSGVGDSANCTLDTGGLTPALYNFI